MSKFLIMMICDRSLRNLMDVFDDHSRIWLLAHPESSSSLAGTGYMATLPAGTANSTSGHCSQVRHLVRLCKDSAKHS